MMRNEHSTSVFAGRNYKFFVFTFFALILFVAQNAAAQSGRVKPTPSPSPEQTEAKTDKPETEPTERVLSLKVTGEIQYESGTHYGTYLRRALDECVESLKDRPSRPLEVTKAGKMKLNDAKELAKKETETHVLWMGFFVKTYIYGIDIVNYVEYIDYAVMKPNTGKVLTYGRIESGKANLGNAGVILQIPTRTSRTHELIQLRQGAREIANILKRGGWLD